MTLNVTIKMKRFVLICNFIFLLFSTLSAQQVRHIDIDFQKEKGKHNKFFNECIGAGRANEGLRADWQNQLKIVKQGCGFKYIRFHGIFHDDMGVYTETKDGRAVYNWQYIDKLYDFILKIGMKPFIELSFMPKALASGKQTVFWWKANVTPPKSYEKYRNFIKAFISHLTVRYGEEELKTWYFEVWNEPNHSSFFSGSKEDYFKIYKNAVNAIKEVSSNYKVGGPSTAGVGWVKDFLDYLDNNDVPIDFVSTHSYNVNGFLDEFGDKQLKLRKYPQVINGVKYAYKKIQDSKFKGTELHFTEWSSSYSSRDPIHDTYINAAFVLNTLKNVEGIANSMSYWVFTDIFEESGIPTTPFHGGFGLMNLQGIKKPTYYSYHYLNQLGDIELQNSDAESWVCKQGHDLQLLFWDYTYLDQGSKSNQTFYKENIASKQKASVNIKVSNMEDGLYTLEVHKTGYKHNDAYTAYYEMGQPSVLSNGILNDLKRASNNQPIEQKVVEIKSGKWEHVINLNENDIVFMKVTKL